MGRGAHSDVAAVSMREPDALDLRAQLRERYTDDHHVYETHSRTRAADGYIGLRLDGRGFSKLTKTLVKPFDERFEAAMEAGCERLMTRIPQVVACYVQSDEVSLVLDRDSTWFDRRVEKMGTVAASIMAVAFSRALDVEAEFDCRVLELPTLADALAMLADRQQDAIKNAVSTTLYWKLRDDGLSQRAATRRLEACGGMHERIAALRELGMDFNDLAPARRRGRMLGFVNVPRVGYNPKTGEHVTTTRRVLEWDHDMGDFRTMPTLPALADSEQA